jgi:hypothetical protein
MISPHELPHRDAASLNTVVDPSTYESIGKFERVTITFPSAI